MKGLTIFFSQIYNIHYWKTKTSNLELCILYQKTKWFSFKIPDLYRPFISLCLSLAILSFYVIFHKLIFECLYSNYLEFSASFRIAKSSNTHLPHSVSIARQWRSKYSHLISVILWLTSNVSDYIVYWNKYQYINSVQT